MALVPEETRPASTIPEEIDALFGFGCLMVCRGNTPAEDDSVPCENCGFEFHDSCVAAIHVRGADLWCLEVTRPYPPFNGKWWCGSCLQAFDLGRQQPEEGTKARKTAAGARGKIPCAECGKLVYAGKQMSAHMLSHMDAADVAGHNCYHCSKWIKSDSSYKRHLSAPTCPKMKGKPANELNVMRQIALDAWTAEAERQRQRHAETTPMPSPETSGDENGEPASGAFTVNAV